MSGYIFNYNDYVLGNNANINITDVIGLARVDTRKSEDFITGADGGNIWERKKGMRIISISGEVYANDLTEYYDIRAAIQAAFDIYAEDTRLSITRSDGLTVSIDAKVVDIPDFKETPGEVAEAIFNIVLKCEDPYFEGDAVVSGQILPGVIGGGPVPSPVPLPLGGVTQQLSLDNLGDIEVKPTFRIDGQILNASVQNETTAKVFTIQNDIIAGDYVNVYENTQGPFVLLNGVTNWFQYKNGAIWKLRRGVNIITFNGSEFDANALLTISFRPKFLSI